MLNRREFIKLGAAAGAGLYFTTKFGFVRDARAIALMTGLSDPATQPKFVNLVPNALDPGFKYVPDANNNYKVRVQQTTQMTGLVGTDGLTQVPTTVWGYGDNRGPTWPGRTFEVQRGSAVTVKWLNQLDGLPHLLPVDTHLHWAYSLPGYTQYSIANNGVPIVPHLHGGHNDSAADGNPEFFFSPGFGVKGPQWVSKNYHYDNNQQAGTLWYHDHALGITRLNVYAGLAGFYILRDDQDTGLPNNPLGLPAGPYELAYAIQDRMFRDTGELFYPAFPGDPAYDDFITGEGAVLPPDQFPGGGPTALAEFFGDHMVVNGMIWPKADVEPRSYRIRLLNGCDSRFMVIRFRAVNAGDTDLTNAGPPLPFRVIGSDQGLASSATQVDTLVFETGSRYDIVFDFSTVPAGSRVIMENIGGDAPFGGDFGDALTAADFFPNRQTDRIMAFDVGTTVTVPDTFNPAAINNAAGVAIAPGLNGDVDKTRRVALFEGKDEFGRLQPLLGIEDAAGNWVPMPWHLPTTENPDLNSTEIWEIYNFTGDAHPIHLHLVHFEVMGRQAIAYASDDGMPGQPVLQHNGAFGTAPVITNVTYGNLVDPGPEYVENAPKDMVTALPNQVTFIKAHFDKPGRYVWHCHILSHEDHEMMRVLHVGALLPQGPVLDDFNRPNGNVGGKWIGPGTKFGRFRIVNNALEVRSTLGLASYMIWNGGKFGADQEAYFTFNQATPTAKDQALLLKVRKLARGGVVGLRTELLAVTYDATKNTVEVKTLQKRLKWTVVQTFTGVTFAPGDIFGAQARADGTIKVFKNADVIGTVTTNHLAAKGGKLGLWFAGLALPPAIIDDFGGGDVI